MTDRVRSGKLRARGARRLRFDGVVGLLLLTALVLPGTFLYVLGIEQPKVLASQNIYLSYGKYTANITAPWYIDLRPDTMDSRFRSSLRLYEDGRKLGPPHAFLEVVKGKGDGAYNHWYGNLFFSSSDNSDPRTNGRQYRISQHLFPSLWLILMPWILWAGAVVQNRHRLYTMLVATAGMVTPRCVRRLSLRAREIRPAGKLARAYAAWWGAGLLVATMSASYLSQPKLRPTLSHGGLPEKLAYYREHKSDFNLVLVGDSLTYTGLHPEFIDPELGTRSVNMAIFAHWFATQYPFFRDLIPAIPRGTRILWSVHLWDFDDNLAVQHVYSVGVTTAMRYWMWGAHNPGLLDNVLYYDPLSRFFLQRDELLASLISLGAKDFPLPRLISRALAKSDYPGTPSFGAATSQTLADRPDLRAKLTDYYSKLPSVDGVELTSDNGKITSVVLLLKGGGYYRIELLPEYFREKQRGLAQHHFAEAFKPAPLAPISLRMFEAALTAFRDAGISVTINVMEEAPWTYGSDIIRKKDDLFLDETLRPIVESYGDDYIRVDYSTISNADFFDYNHLNSQGIAKYTPLLVDKLRQTPAFHRPQER